MIWSSKETPPYNEKNGYCTIVAGAYASHYITSLTCREQNSFDSA